MRRGRTLILMGVLLAIGTAAAVFVIILKMEPEPEPVEMVNAVVATQSIAEQESVDGRLEIQSKPRTALPEGYLTSLDETAGMLAAVRISPGAIIYSDMLISPVEAMQKGELGKLVEPGSLAMAFPIDELSSVSYGIQPGDHVDVLMTFFFIDLDQETQMKEPLCAPLCPAAEGQQEAGLTDQFPRLATQLTLQDIEILGVGRWIKEETPAEEQDNQARGAEPVPVQLPEYVTVMVTPQDALVLKLAREYGASIDLAVRAQDDAQQFVTQQVTLDYILARFGIVLPAKQPYSLEFIDTVRPQTEQ